jgi:ABC-type transport system involved in Fe-S cluster assembly fused permease/ATPase subunit
MEIEKLRGQISLMIVAHRLSTIVDCDRIDVLSNGAIESRGTHSERLLTPKTYKTLYASQNGSKCE